MEVTDIKEEVQKEILTFHQNNPNGVVIIRGATATGKSKLSLLLAETIPLEVISADSRQIFQYMNIGTDKVPESIRKNIPHHLIDIIPPDQQYTAGQRKEQTTHIISEIHSRKKIPFIVGGTGLYIDSIYKNFSMPESAPDWEFRNTLEKREAQQPGILYQDLQKIDPEEALKHHPNSIRYIIRALEIFHTTGKTKTEGFFEQAVQWPLLMIGLRREKEESNMRINARIKEMYKEGMIEEVQGLLKQWYDPNMQSMQGIGYKEVIGFLLGEYDKETMEELLRRNTHHLAKKQRTRFRRYVAEGNASPKKGVTYKNYFL